MKYFFIFAIVSFLAGIAILSYARVLFMRLNLYIICNFCNFSVGYGIIDKIEKLEEK